MKYRFSYASPVLRLIIVNAAFFITVILVNLVSYLFLLAKGIPNGILALPSDWNSILLKPWTFITYQFTHFGVFHFAFNMIILYMAGGIFMDFFRKKDVWRVYIWGGVLAGLLFVLASNYIPAFRGSKHNLIGASGSVMAILFAACTYAPNIRVNLFGVFPVKLLWIALGYLVLDLLSIPESNAGGHIAHLGGALFGWLFAIYRKGHIQIELFEPVIRQQRSEKKMKVEINHSSNYRNTRNTNNQHSHAPTQEEIDAILDKISKSGYEHLSKEEKDILFKASQE